jgi:UDP-N-acetylmuramyl-tripeptide synthetase
VNCIHLREVNEKDSAMPLLPKIFPVACHTDHVGPGSTFVAIPGNRTDGAAFITTAIERGATHIVAKRNHTPFNDATVHVTNVDNPRIALAELSANAAGNPAQHLALVAITGTKGKTTTTHMIRHILASAGIAAAHLSSLDNRILEESEPSTLTTPSSDYLHQFFAAAHRQSVTHVVMEASSEGIDQQRLHGLTFAAIGFTNLGHDHLNYHKTKETYLAAKLSIMTHTSYAVRGSSLDPALDPRIADMIPSNPVITRNDPQLGIAFHLDGTTFAAPHLIGNFNIENAAMAVLICRQLGLSDTQIRIGLASFRGVPGRLNRISLANGAQVVIDFAHNPDSMTAILSTLRPLTKQLIVVFGAGGNKDRLKRPIMGAIAETYGDLVILTSDNPRNEDPDAIINEIAQGRGPWTHYHVNSPIMMA